MMTRRAPVPAPAWRQTLIRQWWRLQWFKALGICAFTTVFFVAYFLVLRHPSGPVTVMPLTPLDAWIAFEPAAFWVYVSLWLYIGIAPSFLPGLRELLLYGVWIGAMCALGLLLFWLHPTAVPIAVHAPDASVATHRGFALMRGLDEAGNACPSMHVASAVFSGAWIAHLLRAVRAPKGWHAVNVAWLAAIAWSTVAVRQHVVLDVLAGAALGLAFAWGSIAFGPRPVRGASLSSAATEPRVTPHPTARAAAAPSTAPRQP